jgi:hypothetical protein
MAWKRISPGEFFQFRQRQGFAAEGEFVDNPKGCFEVWTNSRGEEVAQAEHRNGKIYAYMINDGASF